MPDDVNIPMDTEDPNRLVDRFLAVGFRYREGRETGYVRLSWPGADHRTVVVPTNRASDDYFEKMYDLWLDLTNAQTDGAASGKVLGELVPVNRTDLGRAASPPA